MVGLGVLRAAMAWRITATASSPRPCLQRRGAQEMQGIGAARIGLEHRRETPSASASWF